MLKLLFLLLFLASCSTPTQQPERVVKTEPAKNQKNPQLKRTIITIDAGHGGEDQGTQSKSKPKYLEKSLTLSTARLLKGYLHQLGYQTHMIREKDVTVPLKQRSEMANARGTQLFVSVHFNSAPSTEAQGIEIFYYQADTNPKRTQASKKLAESVLRQVIKTTQARSRGVKHGNLSVVRETEMPAILIEGGFMTNDEEMAKIKNPDYLKKLAWGIAQGIDKYLLEN